MGHLCVHTCTFTDSLIPQLGKFSILASLSHTYSKHEKKVNLFIYLTLEELYKTVYNEWSLHSSIYHIAMYIDEAENEQFVGGSPHPSAFVTPCECNYGGTGLCANLYKSSSSSSFLTPIRIF